MRHLVENTPHETLKDAIADVVYHSPITPKAQADELLATSNVSTIHRWADRDQPDCLPPLQQVVPHARCTGNPALIRFLARRVGHVLVPLREIHLVQVGTQALSLFQQTMLSVVVELGEASAALECSMKDGKLTERELRRCRKECQDLIDNAVLLHEQLKAAEGAMQ